MQDKTPNTIKKNSKREIVVHSAKECAYIAVFVALVIAIQFAFSFVPGVELVTVCFVCYAVVMGGRRAMISATAFSLLRQLVFGFFPNVLLLYLVYFNLLAFAFSKLGKKLSGTNKDLLIVVALSCISTIIFTFTDNLITPIWNGYNLATTKVYLVASIPFMIIQTLSSLISVTALFLPLRKVFGIIKKGLN